MSIIIYKNTTILDIETTGLDADKDKIIEIALLRIKNGTVEKPLSYLVNPQMIIPKKITQLTGISNKNVDSSPLIEDVLPYIIPYISDSLIVAHNAIFDLEFIFKSTMNSNSSFLKNSFVDTRTICIDLFPYESHQLENMCKKLNIEFVGAHRATNDVLATWSLLKILNERCDVKSYSNKLYYFKKHGIPKWIPFNAKIKSI